MLLLLPGPRHISAAPPVEATWIANDVGMCLCVVLVGDAVVVAVAILTTAVACTFEPLWSGTDLGHMPESSAPFALDTLPIGELGGVGDFSWYHPVALEPQSNAPPRSPVWAMHDERNGEAVVAAAVAERIAADTVAAAAAAVDEHIAAAAATAARTIAAASSAEWLLPHLPTDM